MIRKMLLWWMLALAIVAGGPAAADQPGKLGLIKAQQAQAAAANTLLYNRLTALASAAAVRNLVDAKPLTPSPAWQPSTTYTGGQVVLNAGNLYVCSQGGTSAASGGPTVVTDGDAHVDGTAYWEYLGAPEVTTADPEAPAYSLVSSVPADLNTGDLRPNFAQLRMYGATPQATATNKWLMPVYNVNASTVEYSKGSFVAFDTDSQKFAVEQVAGTPGIRVAINGRYYSLGALAAPATTQYHVFDFTANGGRRVRHILIDYGRGSTGNGGVVGRVYFPVKASIWKPAAGNDLRAAFVADSFFDGSIYGPSLPGNTTSNIISRLLGWADPWNFSKGGTGWMNPGAGGAAPFYTYRQRLPQVLAKNPDVIVFMDGGNDYTYAPADVQSEVTASLQTVRASGSKALIVVIGCNSFNRVNLDVTEDAMAAGVAAFNDPLKRTFFIPIVRDPILPWITGTWNNANAPGSNNSAYYVGGDNIHPPEIGTSYLGQRMARGISETVYPKLLSAVPTGALDWRDLPHAPANDNGIMPRQMAG